MNKDRIRKLLQILEMRRKRLGMSRAVVARLSGVPLPTVTRILTGRPSRPSLPNVLAIAETLGAEWKIDPIAGTETLRNWHARQKAARLVATVQGSSALEGQGVDPNKVEELV